MKKVNYFILLCLLLWGWGCHPGADERKGDLNRSLSTGTKTKKILTGVILFKVASHIQAKYMEKNQEVFKDAVTHFFKFLNETAVSKTGITKEKIHLFSSDGRYSAVAGKILQSDHSHWSIKKILAENGIPDKIKSEGYVLFNPYIFLPDSLDRKEITQVTDILTLWRFFYATILMDETGMVDQVYARLMEKISEAYPKDKKVFQNIFNLYKGNDSLSYDAQSLAYYYLITGDLKQSLQLAEPFKEKLREVIQCYMKNYYPRSYITVNDFTLENRVFMWLAARQFQQANDINKANVFIKTTFDNEVLRNVEEFHPNHQAYIYATIRISMQIHSPTMYRYIIGALEPLTKLNQTKFKELLKIQLLQLIK